MEKIYIFGHKKPDTDSVTSAISLSYLKNKLGMNTAPYILGSINNETKYVLNYFNVERPKYLNDVKLQIKDINYNKNYYLSDDATIYDAYNYMDKNGISGLPIVHGDNQFIGMINLKDISREIVDNVIRELHTSYNNLLKTINGEEILKFDDEISGNLLIASYKSESFVKNIKLDNNSILIVGDRYSIIDYAIESKVRMIIVTGDNTIAGELLEKAKNNKVNIIKSTYDTFNVAKFIQLSNYIATIVENKSLTCFDENDFVNNFKEISEKLKYTNYPIVNKKGKCLGLLKINDISDKKKKKVILVDHNDHSQSVDGLEEAEIVEVIDHHNIGNINTPNPINFKTMSVGCTNTIIYSLYKEHNIAVPKEIAGLMLSGIISDTLLFNSPTTTSLDKEAAKELEKIADVDINKYGMDMLKAGTSIKGKSVNDILYTDFKEYTVNNKKVGIAQIFTMNFEEIEQNMAEYVKLIEDTVKNNNYYMINLYVTDIIKKGSYILYNESSKSILENSLNIDNLHQGYYVDGIVSRKKQVIPFIMEELEK